VTGYITERPENKGKGSDVFKVEHKRTSLETISVSKALIKGHTLGQVVKEQEHGARARV